MSCDCTCTSRSCGTGVVGLPILLAAGVVYGLVHLVGLAWSLVSLPGIAWLALASLAVSGVVWGLWLGFAHHGRAEPLAVGMFGLVVAGLGFIAWEPLALIGVVITLGAAAWSALLYAERRLAPDS